MDKVTVVKQGGSGDGGVEGVGNLAHFEHKRTLFNMDNTIFSLTSGASCYNTMGGQGSNRSRGLSPFLSPHFNHWLQSTTKNTREYISAEIIFVRSKLDETDQYV